MAVDVHAILLDFVCMMCTYVGHGTSQYLVLPWQIGGFQAEIIDAAKVWLA